MSLHCLTRFSSKGNMILLEKVGWYQEKKLVVASEGKTLFPVSTSSLYTKKWSFRNFYFFIKCWLILQSGKLATSALILKIEALKVCASLYNIPSLQFRLWLKPVFECPADPNFDKMLFFGGVPSCAGVNRGGSNGIKMHCYPLRKLSEPSKSCKYLLLHFIQIDIGKLAC